MSRKQKKGQAAYDLLNLKYESYEAHRSPNVKAKPVAKRRTDGGYVLANYRFAVNMATMSDLSFLKHPDHLVDWSAIHQVTFNTTFDEYQCPICLSYPAAARITKCGHMFCLGCVLQYIEANGGGSTTTCPMCSQFLHANQLRLAVPNFFEPVRLGDIASFVLVRRPKGSIVSWIASSTLVENLPNIAEMHQQSAHYSRYSSCTYEDIIETSKRDAAEIRDRLATTDPSTTDESEKTQRDCLLKALEFVELQQATALQESLELSTGGSPVATGPQGGSVPGQAGGNSPGIKPQGKKSKNSPSISPQKPLSPESAPTAGQTTPADCFYTYMAANGQPLYLSPLNMRMLLWEIDQEAATAQHVNIYEDTGRVLNKSLDTTTPNSIPLSIDAKVIQIDWNTMDENNNRKWKHLRHLPSSSDFAIVELDLSRVVSRKCLQHFSSQLENAAKRRAHIRRKEAYERAASDRKHQQEVEQRREASTAPEVGSYPALHASPSLEAELNQEIDENDPFWQTPDNAGNAEPQGEPTTDLQEIQAEQRGESGVWASSAPASSTLHWGGRTAANGSKESTPTFAPTPVPLERNVHKPWGAFTTTTSTAETDYGTAFPAAPTTSPGLRPVNSTHTSSAEPPPPSHTLIDELLKGNGKQPTKPNNANQSQQQSQQQQQQKKKGKKPKGKTVSLTSFQRQ
eukprot:TRINITY_DN112623_c0_g1_i1.p1 TRINITY_DN112623_c0_g1~~TRINITY_DN112623_c0_g1_i1.p1  ORF type:complete len:685 (+),score=74.25 TRINITY_DN112623_c0_g1_i1:27-2081(+)